MNIILSDGREAKLSDSFELKPQEFYNQSKQHLLLFKIESLINDGIIYPHEIKKVLNLSRRDIGVCLRSVYNINTEKYFGQVVYLKCKNPNCNKGVCYDRCICEYQYYCSRRCTSIVTTNSESFKKIASKIGKETCKKINSNKALTQKRLKNLRAVYVELVKDEEFQKRCKEFGSVILTKLHANPEFAKANSERSRIRLGILNQDPEFRAKADKTLNLLWTDPQWREKRIKECSDAMIKKNSNPEFVEKSLFGLRNKVWNNKELMSKIHSSRYNTRYEIHGLKCMSGYEKRYIENLFEQGLHLPKNCEPIKTPYGFYTPDFDHGDYFVEIKSCYTYKIFLNSLQKQKVDWINKNIKRIKVYNLDDVEIKKILQLR